MRFSRDSCPACCSAARAHVEGGRRRPRKPRPAGSPAWTVSVLLGPQNAWFSSPQHPSPLSRSLRPPSPRLPRLSPFLPRWRGTTGDRPRRSVCCVGTRARERDGQSTPDGEASLGDGLLRPREEKDLATKLRTRIPRVTAACVVRRRGEFGGNRGGRRARWVWRTNNPNGRVPWDRLHLRGPANYHPPPRFQASPQDRPRLAAAC